PLSADLDTCVARALTGRSVPASAGEARRWLERAEEHRVHLLLADRWLGLPGTSAVSDLRGTLVGILAAAFVSDAIRGAECRRVYSALSSARIRAAVLKGAALAHTVYEAPHLRPRCDTDILIDSDSAAAVARTLFALGYTADVETS